MSGCPQSSPLNVRASSTGGVQFTVLSTRSAAVALRYFVSPLPPSFLGSPLDLQRPAAGFPSGLLFGLCLILSAKHFQVVQWIIKIDQISLVFYSKS